MSISLGFGVEPQEQRVALARRIRETSISPSQGARIYLPSDSDPMPLEFRRGCRHLNSLKFLPSGAPFHEGLLKFIEGEACMGLPEGTCDGWSRESNHFIEAAGFTPLCALRCARIIHRTRRSLSQVDAYSSNPAPLRSMSYADAAVIAAGAWPRAQSSPALPRHNAHPRSRSEGK